MKPVATFLRRNSAGPKPKPAPATTPRRVVTNPGEYVTNIARRTGWGDEWRTIYAANRSVIGHPSQPIPAGTTLVIPDP